MYITFTVYLKVRVNPEDPDHNEKAEELINTAINEMCIEYPEISDNGIVRE